MKKILILIFSLSIFSFSFADWTTVVEPLEGFGIIRFNKNEDTFSLLYDTQAKEVGIYLLAENHPPIKGSSHMIIFIDDGAIRKYPLEHSKNTEYESFLTKEEESTLIKDMKKGKKITIKIEGSSDTLVVEYPLEGFKETYNKFSEKLK